MTSATTPVASLASRSLRIAMLVDHDAQRSLCDDLEQLADDLPRLPGSDRLRQIGARLEALADTQLPLAGRALAEEIARAGSDPRLKALLNELVAMHALDALHAHDVATALAEAGGRTVTERATELGYMFRCLFEGCRRTIVIREALLCALSCTALERAGAQG